MVMESMKLILVVSLILLLGACSGVDKVALEPAYVPKAELGTYVPRAGMGHDIKQFNGFTTVDQRVAQHGYRARKRLKPYFDKAGVAYPPKSIVLVGLKKERRLEVYAGDDRHSLKFIRSYSVLGASGTLGPKLREGDRQVPEGVYRIDAINPNSRYHLSLRVNYPNAFDRRMASIDGRSELGGDIFIHGKAISAGCLAMGDWVAEELFVMVADNTTNDVRVILSPVDFRASELPRLASEAPAWTGGLYRQIKYELSKLANLHAKT
jgi:hypothetical protein